MLNIALLAPSPIRGSGGVARIYNFASALNENGYVADIYVSDSAGRSGRDLREDARRYYAVDSVHVVAGVKLEKKYDLIIATQWETARVVRDMPATTRAYFIQDFEACFNPVGDGTILAENSYLYGLKTITYGRWLALKLYSEFGNSSYYCNFSTDPTVFRLRQDMKNRLQKPPAICFIYQHDKPRRCPQLGIEALGIVKNLRPDVELYFVGSAESPSIWYDYTNMGLLSTEGLNEVYNRCHVGLCLSSSNPSCNAFDMMSAGLPSVDLYRENNLFDVPAGGVLLAHQTPESLAEAILTLISNPEKLVKMSDFGIAYMKSKSAKSEKKEFLSAIHDILSGKEHEFDVAEVLRHRYTAQPVVAAAYRTPLVLRHIKSQLDRYTGTGADPISEVDEPYSGQKEDFVTSMSPFSSYSKLPGTGVASTVKRVINRLFSSVR
jgi:glycosyltransferase involved in cell wall biosynthesis